MAFNTCFTWYFFALPSRPFWMFTLGSPFQGVLYTRWLVPFCRHLPKKKSQTLHRSSKRTLPGFSSICFRILLMLLLICSAPFEFPPTGWWLNIIGILNLFVHLHIVIVPYVVSPVNHVFTFMSIGPRQTQKNRSPLLTPFGFVTAYLLQ